MEKVVAFRGTKPGSIHNYFTDLQVRRVVFDGDMRVHSGFFRGYKSVWEHPSSSLLATGKPTLITGHSLGGGEAVIYAASLPLTLQDVPIYTFGQPRVGNRAFAEFVARRHPNWWRIIDRADIVARVAWLFGLYAHRGNVAFIDEAGRVDINPPQWHELYGVIKAIRHEWRMRRGIALAHDHEMSLYLRAMRRVLGRERSQ